ncbi:MAG: tetratricopeptide repeat protein, partial [Limisphaerales bacterium]
SPLWQIRRSLHKLNESDEFVQFHEEHPGREVAWVAEWSEPGLGMKQPLEIVDRLVEVLAQSELYIGVLADARSGTHDHGSPVSVADRISATSYLEIELYAAAMYRLPCKFFILEGFSPGPRLQFLLKLLDSSFPGWRDDGPMSPPQILERVRQYIASHLRQPLTVAVPLRQRLVQELYQVRAKPAPPGHEIENVLFLDGEFEPRQLPQKDLVQVLIADAGTAPEMQRKLSRMWIAARELMSASYLPKDVQADNRLSDFLPLWDKVLGLWTGAAAWSGWHCHIYAGTVAPLNSQTVIREQMQGGQPPNAPLASAYYSIANLMKFGWRRLECLRRSSRYIEEAMRRDGGKNPGRLAIRGMIRLRLGNLWGAVLDFKEMLRLRETNGAAPEQIGDAMVHLGFAYLCCGRWLKGRDYLERGVLSLRPDDPGIVRAKRKLVLAYKLTGRSAEAKHLLEQADADAIGLGALDQIRHR